MRSILRRSDVGTAMSVAALMVLAACGQTATTTPTADDAVADTAVNADVAGDDTTADAATATDAAGDATGTALDPTKPETWPAGEKGPFACGLRILEMKYQLPGNLGERVVPLYVWYPAAEAKGDHPMYMGIFEDPASFLDAPLAPSPYAAGYPLLVHSHGYKGFSGNSAFLMCHIATHGWVAMAPEHVGNTLGDTPDPLPLLVSLQRPLDMQHTIDWATTPPAGDPLAGKIDVAHIGLSGHSFGTYTVWAVAGAPIDVAALTARCGKTKPDWPDCSQALLDAYASTVAADPRVDTFISLAGDGSDIFIPGGKNLVKAPLLQMNGTLNDSGETQLFNDVTGVDLTWVDVEGGCHQLYGLGNSILGDPACLNLPNEEGFAIVRPFFLAWLRYHALGDHGPEVTGIVTGTTTVSPKATLKHKSPL